MEAAPCCQSSRAWTCKWALEVRAEWVGKLKSGEKRIEVRAYPLPQLLIGVPIAIVVPADMGCGHIQQSPCSGLPDVVPAGLSGAHVAGCVVFERVKLYKSEDEFVQDQPHCVPIGSPYGWQQGDL
mmetsp:Transcript_19626/g.33923  ORF Transcript_19626/g.33923 Transcript_19626/m.33923 type:complete len:126 (+) Transcript_19626:24-401(+)